MRANTMATNNKNKSSFNVPTIGHKYPKGSTIKRNKDGTISVVPPKKGKKQ